MGIRDSYRSLSKKLHPDSGGDTESMQELNELYEAARTENTVYVDRPVERIVYKEKPSRGKVIDIRPANSDVNDQRNIYRFYEWAKACGKYRQLCKAGEDTVYEAYLQWMDFNSLYE